MTLAIVMMRPVIHVPYIFVLLSFAICLAALWLIVRDWRRDTVKRVIVAAVLASAIPASVAAASKKSEPTSQLVMIDPCSQEPIASLPWWEKLLLGCW